MKEIYLLVGLLSLSNLCFGQRDASLTYIDLIAQNNLLVKESRNQYIINWGEIPNKIEGASRMTETFFRPQFDSTQAIDSIIIIDSIPTEAMRVYSDIYEYKQLENDRTQIVIDSSFIVTYHKDTLISQEEYGNIMRFNYYPSGILKELVLKTGPLLKSELLKDTIFYTVNLPGHLSKNIMSSDNFPTINIKFYKSDDGECFHYQNIFFFKKLLEQAVINKELIQCQNGNMMKELVLDRLKKYAQKEKDYDFEYDEQRLVKKTCKPDVKYAEYMDIEYVYDAKGNIKEIIGNTITSEFTYDERNNIVSRLDYFTGSKKLQKLFVREIEYKK